MKKEKKTDYRSRTHFYGRIWILSALTLFICVPAAICLHYGVWPAFHDVFVGLLGVAPVFWSVAVIEVFTYVPMLGTGGSYLGFLTGNLTNLKEPSALNAKELAHVDASSEQGEAVSTIAIATSSLVTTLIIALGVLLLVPLRPILESEALAPAFANIVPALFGALAVVYVSKNAKIAIAPMIFMLALFISVPSLASSVGIFVPVGALIAIGASRILYKKGKL